MLTHDTRTAELRAIGARAAAHDDIAAYHALLRRTIAGAPRIVLYVVPALADRAPPASVFADLVPDGVELRIVAVSTLPYTADGRVDESALAALPTWTPAAFEHIRETLAADPRVEDVAVLATAAAPPVRRLHRGVLDPDWQRPGAPGAPAAEAEAITAAPLSGPPAEVDGGPLEPPPFASLAEVLQRAAERTPEASVTFVDPAGGVVGRTHRWLHDEARRICAALQARGAVAGDRVILALEAAEDVLPAFWGCLWGGMLPLVMEVPATFGGEDRAFLMLGRVAAILDAPLLICRDAQLPEAARVPGVASVFGLGALEGDPRAATLARPALDAPAFYCFSSGSTGVPKCVVLTHRCVLMRNAGANALNDHRADDVNLNWLPFDHIGSLTEHIRSLMLGCRLVYALKDHILEAPLRLLDIIDAHRVTHTWGPNFVYALVSDALSEVRADDDGRRWDLSCVRFLISGGEAASHDAMRRFLTRTAPFGFPATGFRPSFGMVEVAAGITYAAPTVERPLGFVWASRGGGVGARFAAVSAGAAGARAYGLLGRPIPGCVLRIVDADGAVVPEGVIGRVQFRGAPLAAGYLGDPELTGRVFLDDGWLETEDLGFVTDGRLVLTGRTKEMLIINGVNLYSRELEDVVEALDHVQVSYTAACAVRPRSAPTEQLAIFFSPDPDADVVERIRAIRTALVRRCRANPDHIVPLPADAIPKTAIGKIKRLELARRFERGAYEAALRALDLAAGNQYTVADRCHVTRWVEQPPVRGAKRQGQRILVVGEPGPRRDAVEAALRAAGRAAVALPSAQAGEAVEPANAVVWLPPAAPLAAYIAELRAYAGLDAREAGSTRLVVLLDPERPHAPGLLGAVAACAHEAPHLDVVTLEAPVDGPGLLDTLDARDSEPHLRYPRGRRHVRRLSPFDWSQGPEQAAEPRGAWIVLGGEEENGRAFARRLLARGGARPVLVEREPCPAEVWPEGVRRITADIDTPEGLDAVLAAADRFAVDGVAHFAPNAPSRLLVDEDPSALGARVEARIEGLRRLDAALGDVRWLHLTSVSGLLGGFAEARTAALHAAVDAFAAAQRRAGRRAQIVISTPWVHEGAGHSRAAGHLDARGLKSWPVEDGLDVLFGALRRGADRLVLGLDPDHPALRPWVLEPPRTLTTARAWVSPRAPRAQVTIEDEFGVAASCRVHGRSTLPRRADGAVDAPALLGRDDTPTGPRTALERLLVRAWSAVLKAPVGIHDDFFERGGDSIKAVMAINQLQRHLGGILHPVSLLDAPTVAGLAAYLERHYPQVVEALSVEGSAATAELDAPATAAQAAHMRRYLRTRLAGVDRRVDARGPINRRAIFILSPARSGSTLLRASMGGNPALFSPPELYLLGFRGLAERRAAFSGRQAFLREGVIRALMALDDLDFETAEARMSALEADDVPVKALYAELQRRIGDRILVDKTPPYAFDPAILRRMEAEFDAPLYVHLQRHPGAMVHSFEEARVDLAVAVHGDEDGTPLTTRQKGELWWRISHENIIGFLGDVPAGRQHVVRFEELVRAPEAVLRDLCRFVGVPFDQAMLDPRRDSATRMTDGAHHFSRHAGDPKFHTHRGISAAAADRWRTADPPIRLADETWSLAREMGYAPDVGRCPPELAPFAVVDDPARRGEPFPLTDIQEAYWAGRNPAFDLGGRSVHAYTEIEGHDVDVARLQRALDAMVRRHEMLRTVIGDDGLQRILTTVPAYRIAIDDLRGLSRGDREARLDEIRRRMSHQVLPCATWPTFEVRASLIDDDVTRIHLSVDALFFDARSKYIFFEEWRAFYADEGEGLPRLSLSFRDYVLAEQRIGRSAIHARDRAYWLERIDDLPGPPELPLVARPEDLGTPRFFQRNHVLDPDTWARIKARAARARLTPSAVLLAVFADALRPWSRAERFTLNLTTYRRLPLHPDVDRVIGDFSSVVLLAVEPPEEQGFAERARGLHRRLIADLAHGAFSGVEVLRELARRRGGSSAARAPVVFTSVLGDEMHRPGEDPLGWLGDVVYNVTQTPQIWFDHIAFEEAGGLLCRWNFVEGLFAPGVPDALFEAYLTGLERLADDDAAWRAPWPETRAALLPPTQRAARAAYNDTAVRWPDELWLGGRLHDGFVERARREPDAVAVIADDRTLTYAELAGWANRIGRALRARGAKPGETVAVSIPKSAAQVAAVLGVLMSGAAYVPVDPSLPTARIDGLIAQSAARWLVCTAESHQTPPTDLGVLTLEVDGQAVRDAESGPLDVVQAPSDLAYVIFTSGSTGRPKGVAIDHRGAWNTVVDINRRFAVGPDDRVLALSALGFDLSVYDIFGLLAAGGAIVMPRPADVREPARWAELVERHRVTLWNTVPAFVGVLVDYADGPHAARLASLRAVLMSGDWIPLTLPDRIRALPGAPRPISLGGATEGSIWSIWHPIDAVDPAWASIPYGRPLDNQTMHVLDESLEPCPDWVPGMIHIGGVGVALAYFGDPERTAASFVRHPRTGERLYRTGDLGRMVPDADGVHIEFLGRVDHQVKVQGFRVELGEIEACLDRHPDVAASVVAALGERHADKVLVGYVVPAPTADAAGLGERLAAFCATRLPRYMVPARWMTLDGLPLSANGKVDRKALPSPERPARVAAAPTSTAGRSGADVDRIAAVVADVLEQPVGPEDDLFDLGATSVDLMRIANALTRRLGLELTVDRIFHQPSVAGIALLVGGDDAEPVWGGDALAALVARYPRLRDPDARAAFHARAPGTRPRAGPAVEFDPAVSPAIRQLRRRRSHRAFDQAPLPLADLAELMSALRQFDDAGGPRRAYGSAGGLYPVQALIYVKPDRVDGLEGGYHHYDPVGHRLVRVSDRADFDRAVFDAHINRPIWRQAAFSIHLVADMSAIVPMYGARSLQLCAIEAGLMSQSLELHAPTARLGLCQMGGVEFERVRRHFGVDEAHLSMHALMGGRPVATEPIGGVDFGAAAGYQDGPTEDEEHVEEIF